MICRKVFTVVVIFLCLPLASFAKAEENFRLQSIDVSITSELEQYSDVSTSNMLSNEILYDFDTWPGAIQSLDGLYWGPAIQCSKLSLGTQYSFSIVSVLNLTSIDISSGASDYWLRIPVNGLNVESFYISIDGSEYDLAVTPGEGWNTQVFENHGDTEHIYYTSNGIFVRLQQIISTSYKFSDTSGGDGLFSDYVTIRSEIFWNDAAEVLVTNENYTISESILMWDFYGAYSQNYSINLSARLGWSFFFLKGLSNVPLYTYPFFYDSLERSSSLYNRPTESYILIERNFDYDFNESYFTVDFPFVGEDIDFFIKVEISSGIFNFTGYLDVWYANITSKTDHLCFSPPQIWDNGSDGINIDVWLFPSADILLLGAFDVNFYELLYPAGSSIYDYTTVSRLSDHRFVSDAYYTTYYRSPVCCSITETMGIVAEISFSSTFQFVNFGWGRGIIYPGEVWFNIYLDNDTAVYWSGNAGVLLNEMMEAYRGQPSVDASFSADSDDEAGLFQLVLSALSDVGSTLWDGIKGVVTSLWDSIKGAFEWITRVIMDFVGKIIAYLKNLVQYFGNMIKGILYIFPPLMVVLGARFALGPKEFRQRLSEDKEYLVSSQKKYFNAAKKVVRRREQ